MQARWKVIRPHSPKEREKWERRLGKHEKSTVITYAEAYIGPCVLPMDA